MASPDGRRLRDAERLGETLSGAPVRPIMDSLSPAAARAAFTGQGSSRPAFVLGVTLLAIDGSIAVRTSDLRSEARRLVIGGLQLLATSRQMNSFE